MKININILLPLGIALLLVSCDQFLSKKSDQQLVTPDNLPALQALLDHTGNITANFCSAGEVSADDYYLKPEGYNYMVEDIQRMYRWEPNYVFSTETTNDWMLSYQTVYICNAILKALEDIPEIPVNKSNRDFIKGQALVHRGFHFLDAAWVWCKSYDAQTAQTDMGLPLRLDPDFNLPSVRSTVQETYDQLIGDLKASIPLLPINSINAYRASKPMAYALLARAYLSMRQYENAYTFADSCLQLRQGLVDFNTLDVAVPNSLPTLNVEVIFNGLFYNSAIYKDYGRIPQDLVNSYQSGDLRRAIYFSQDPTDGSFVFKGNFTGDYSQLCGPTVGEMLIIRSECAARLGNTASAITDLNFLLKNRWDPVAFLPISGLQGDALVQKILVERRKELLMRDLRWMDIRRLNADGAGISLSREVEGIVYHLEAGSPKFILPIPEAVIDQSGMPQNPR
ncbi:SusD family protein [bacterium A37T11]|nr:SusD family protein [bacterium A37T11]